MLMLQKTAPRMSTTAFPWVPTLPWCNPPQYPLNLYGDYDVIHRLQVITPYQQVLFAAPTRKSMEEWMTAFRVASQQTVSLSFSRFFVFF